VGKPPISCFTELRMMGNHAVPRSSNSKYRRAIFIHSSKKHPENGIKSGLVFQRRILASASKKKYVLSGTLLTQLIFRRIFMGWFVWYRIEKKVINIARIIEVIWWTTSSSSRELWAVTHFHFPIQRRESKELVKMESAMVFTDSKILTWNPPVGINLLRRRESKYEFDQPIGK